MKKIEQALCCGNVLIDNLERQKESKISCVKLLNMIENKLKTFSSKESEWNNQEGFTLNELQKILTKNFNSSRRISGHLRNQNEQTQKQILNVGLEFKQNLQYQQGEVDRLAVAESDLLVSNEICEHLKLSEMQRDNEMKVLANQFTDIVDKNRNASAKNDQLEESVLQLLAIAQNENMIMQIDREKLLGEKAQDEALLAEDIRMLNA